MSENYLQLVKESRRIADNKENFKEIRLAILGDSTTQQLAQVLKASLYRKRIFAHIYESEFDVIDQEIYNPQSSLYSFKPDFVLLHLSTQRIREDYYRRRLQPTAELAKEWAQKVAGWWQVIGKQCGCRIIQNLWVTPLERPFGHYTVKVQSSFYNEVRALNHAITEAAGREDNVLLNDVDYLASTIGKTVWFDEAIWTHAKVFCHLECLADYAQDIGNIILASLGITKKCLVLDLDNTLWGGIVGEDGVSALEVGPEGLGQAFSLFQHYLKELKDRGLILAVCSKNDEETARNVFRRHPGMVLKEEDIAVFVANWNNKSFNIQTIAKTLNIGLDALVFIDDSSFERNEVRAVLPEVCVPEMPEDPALSVPYLNSLGFFEAVTYSREDQNRTRYYLQDTERGKEQARFDNIDEYLKSLEMEAEFARFDDAHLPRIVQLLARSNQFNLTTRRYSEQDCRNFMNNLETHAPFYITLKDKFGDSGLISVIILKNIPGEIIIDTWLMSCRVLKRGVEELSMNKVVAYAQERQARHITGEYWPTEKNKMVRDFYGQFGFKKIRKDKGGKILWQLNVQEYKARLSHIRCLEREPWPA